jgi:hypothetical protein
VGRVYLKGCRHRSYIGVCKDAFDGAVCLRLAGSRRMDEVLCFLEECWKDLGIPEQVQFDNARESSGWGPAARTLSRVIRLCLRFRASQVFIPEGEAQFNGCVETFNGWFQEPRFQRRFRLATTITRTSWSSGDRHPDRITRTPYRGGVRVMIPLPGLLKSD